ncbi:MAG: histidine triad nucleotide-binding protein [Candidatus Nanopelagicales bacterium]|nr:histidine triad nucleotide-binding protein [Candidatus Nanopelagicales bacterium]MDZ4249184.1 histidine triad nucleotide-binding protein [Candidatus Nanopelagicales bacterium]
MAACLFCRVGAGEIPSSPVYRDDQFYAFHDIDPKAPVHVLVIPLAHHANVADLTAADETQAGELLRLAAKVAADLGLDERGYRVVINTGSAGGQSVDHVHAHVLGGRQMKWPPG